MAETEDGAIEDPTVEEEEPVQLRLSFLVRNRDPPGSAPMQNLQLAALATFATKDQLRHGDFIKASTGLVVRGAVGDHASLCPACLFFA